MGISISIIAKECSVKIPQNQVNQTTLSRNFYRFICNNENFQQVEKLLNINLSILKLQPESLIHFNKVMDEYTYQEYLAELDNDLEKVQLLNQASKMFAKEWQKDYDKNMNGWIEIERMQNFIETLLDKINQKPTFYEKIKFDNNNPYFHQKLIHNSKQKYLDNNFSEDLQSILNWIEFTKVYKVQYVSFDFG